MKVMDLSAELAALHDLQEKGEITPAQCAHKRRRLTYLRNMQIAVTNGGYTQPTKGRKRLKLEESRKVAIHDQTIGLKDRILAETAMALAEENKTEPESESPTIT